MTLCPTWINTDARFLQRPQKGVFPATEQRPMPLPLLDHNETAPAVPHSDFVRSWRGSSCTAFRRTVCGCVGNPVWDRSYMRINPSAFGIWYPVVCFLGLWDSCNLLFQIFAKQTRLHTRQSGLFLILMRLCLASGYDSHLVRKWYIIRINR